MKLTDILLTANKNLTRNKGRTLLTILAIFIGSFSIITTIAMRTGVNKFIDDQINSYGGDGMLQITAAGLGDAFAGKQTLASGEPVEYDKAAVDPEAITDEQIEKLKQIEGILPGSVHVTHSTPSDSFITSDLTEKKYLADFVMLPPGDIHIAVTAGRNVDDQSGKNEVMLPESYVSALGFASDEDAVGRTIEYHFFNDVTRKEKIVAAEVTGIQAPGVITQSSVYANSAFINAVNDLYLEGLPEEAKEYADRAYMAVAEYDYKNYSAEDVKKKVKDAGLSAMTVSDMVGQIRNFFDTLTIVFTAFGLISLVTAAIGIINTLYMSVQERTREIGLDKALGESSGHVFLSFSLEAAMLGFWGSLVGTIFSVAAGNIMNGALHSEGGMLEALPTFDLLVYSPENIIGVIIVIMLIAFFAGTAPALKAAREDPIDALRYE